MTAVPLAAAARLLGKPERTVRRWAASGKLPATRTADGWLVEINVDADGQVAANDRGNGHSSGQVAADSSATGGQLAAVPVSYLRELELRAEAAAFWQGRASVLEARVLQLEAQPALPPASSESPSDHPTGEPTRTPAAPPQRRSWWQRLPVWRRAAP